MFTFGWCSRWSVSTLVPAGRIAPSLPSPSVWTRSNHVCGCVSTEQLWSSSRSPLFRAPWAWPRSFTRSFSLSSSHCLQERFCVGFHLSFFHVFAPSHTRSHTHTHTFPIYLYSENNYKVITFQRKMGIFLPNSSVSPLSHETINDEATHEAKFLSKSAAILFSAACRFDAHCCCCRCCFFSVCV